MALPDRISPAPADALSTPARRAAIVTTADAAFAVVVEPFVQRLYRFLVLRLRDEREARDALQETLLAAWQGLPRLREGDRPWPWLVGIAAHKAADVGRRSRPELQLEEQMEARIYAVDESRHLREALRRLPSKAREVLLLRYYLRLSEEETAAALGLPVGTVKSRAARARQMLLKELA